MACQAKQLPTKTPVLILNKLLPIFVLPLGLALILLAYALASKKRWPIVVAITMLYVASVPVTGSWLVHWLETRYAMLAPSDLNESDAVVVLSGFVGPPVAAGYVPNLLDASERLEAGITIWQQNKAKLLVFTGGQLPWIKQSEVEGEQAKRIAVARGIPEDRIVVTQKVGNTADESQAIAQLVRERKWNGIILVTTGWHMPRAARLFRKAGVNFVPFPVDYRVDPNVPLTLLDFLPCASALSETECVFHELYGLAFYAVTGR